MGKPDKKQSQSPELKIERCPAESCGKPAQRMHFCSEHFEWFKAGLVNKMGQKPSDFDKKYQAYTRKKAA